MSNSADHFYGVARLARVKAPGGQVYSWLSLTDPHTAPDIMYHQPTLSG